MKCKWVLFLPVALLLYSSLFAQAKVIEVPFEFYKNELVAEVMIDGKGPFMMLLDTGTDPSAIDLATADAIGIRHSGKGHQSNGGGTEKNLSYECKLRNVEIGSLKAGTIDAAAIDLSKVSERMGKHLDGVIGYSLFKGRIVQFDYPKSVVRFFDSEPKYSSHATILKFRYQDNVLVDDVWINGTKVVANLDTGSGGTTDLSPKAIAKLGLSEAAARGAVHSSVGYNGAFENHEGKLASLKLGDVIANDVPVIFFSPGTGHDKVPWDVNIGNRFMKDYVVTLDYVKKTVTLEKP